VVLEVSDWSVQCTRLPLRGMNSHGSLDPALARWSPPSWRRFRRPGKPLSRLDELAQSIDYSKFADPTLLARIPIVGPALSLLTRDGLYQGDYLENLLTGLLGDLGCGRSVICAPASSRSNMRGSLVVTASDLSRRRLVRIPWDLPNYGVDPDEFSVAHTVRASSAVPFAFEPVEVSGATWVEGSAVEFSGAVVRQHRGPAAVADIWHSAFGTARYAADSPDPGSVVVGVRRAGNADQRSGRRLYR
jgi:hypothetical protein